jgi:hypothetical protein
MWRENDGIAYNPGKSEGLIAQLRADRAAAIRTRRILNGYL